MVLQSFLLSRDGEVLRVLRRVLPGLGMDMHVCVGVQEATKMLGRRKFHAIMVDCDHVSHGEALLKTLRSTASNKTSIAFAIVDGATGVRLAFDLGANFVLEKPLTVEGVERSLRAAQGLLLREQKRYFRHAVPVPVTLSGAQGPGIQGTLTNVSEGGLALRLRGKLPEGSLRVSFVLPEVPFPIEGRVEVAWRDSLGRAGLRFLYLPEKARQALDTWLSRKLKQGH